MKLQDLNRSFAKVLGALAIAFVIQTGSAQAQQGQWAADGCFYTAVFSAAPSGALQGSVQMVRRGCAVQSPDGQARYYDLGTGQLYLMENNPSQQGSKVGKIFKSHRQPQASHSGTSGAARRPGDYGPAGNAAGR